MKIGLNELELGKKTYIMGILNITPDSFFDGGKYHHIECAINQAKKMIGEGVDILDIGGESTRPNHTKISVAEEISRVIPVIATIKKQFPLISISIDTYKSEVCEAAILAGANFINDIWGFRYDKKMAVLAAKYDLPCCLMHNREVPVYTDFYNDVVSDLKESVSIALSHGVKPEKIILDPGIGFAKTYEQNLFLLNNLDRLKADFPDYPLLLGTSRKSVIGKTLGDISPKDRLIGTISTTVLGILKGCDFIRIHDVKENKEACLMTDAICR